MREALRALPRRAKGKVAKERAALVYELEHLLGQLDELGVSDMCSDDSDDSDE